MASIFKQSHNGIQLRLNWIDAFKVYERGSSRGSMVREGEDEQAFVIKERERNTGIIFQSTLIIECISESSCRWCCMSCCPEQSYSRTNTPRNKLPAKMLFQNQRSLWRDGFQSPLWDFPFSTSASSPPLFPSGMPSCTCIDVKAS